MTEIVKLNVGGTIFQTTKSTLTKLNGYFKTMLETRKPIAKDESGAIFIDRDPTYFRLILNFMRDGHVNLQKYSEDVKEIEREAEYYLLYGLAELCITEVLPKPEISHTAMTKQAESEAHAKYRNLLKTIGFQVIFGVFFGIWHSLISEKFSPVISCFIGVILYLICFFLSLIFHRQS
ncbi:unnamed protein product [Caenorhabditis nigoni]